MVDNRGISPLSASHFKSDNASANKMSDEKYGQGGEYFLQEMQEETENTQQSFQDRSAQLRASLNGLAMANAGSIRLMKVLKEKEEKEKKKNKHSKGEEFFEEENEEMEFLD